MRNYIIVGCDMSDESMVLRCARNEEAPETRRFGNDAEGRGRMVRHLEERARAAGGAKLIFAYEAGPHGFGLGDELTARRIQCHALALLAPHWQRPALRRLAPATISTTLKVALSNVLRPASRSRSA